MELIVEGSDVQFEFTLVDQNNNALDLTGATVNLVTRAWSKQATVTDAAAGVCVIDIGPTDVTGTLEGDIRVTMPNGKIHIPYEKVNIFARKGAVVSA